MKDQIYTKLRWCGQRIYIEATDNKFVNAALVTTFKDDWRKTAPLDMSRADVKLVTAWARNKPRKNLPKSKKKLDK